MQSSKQKHGHKNRFSTNEDNILIEQVKIYGTSNWNKIAEMIPTKSPRQCRERWCYYLSSDVISGFWTEYEDKIIMDSVQEFGTKWAKIAKRLNHRTQYQIKNRYTTLLRRLNKLNYINSSISSEQNTANPKEPPKLSPVIFDNSIEEDYLCSDPFELNEAYYFD